MVALAVYFAYACTILDFTWQRFLIGLGHGSRFIGRMWPPDLATDKLALLYTGMIESLQIAIIATVVGVLLALPLGMGAARNLAPLPVAWTARALIALFRTFHPVIVAILFVKAVGFGALAGMLALVVGLAGISLQARRRGGRGDVDASGGSRTRNRRPVPLAGHHGGASAGHAALHRLLGLSARFQICGTRHWSVWSAAAASAPHCSRRSSASTMTSC